MSVPTSLLPADASTSVADRRTGPARDIDRVHDHVLRVVGDEVVAGRVVADVAARASSRARELGESPTFEGLVRLAHARLTTVTRARPDDALVARLAGDRDPGGPPLVRALAAADRHGTALLDLTTRHDVDLRRAAELIGVDRSTASRARTQALHQVRSDLAEAGLALDVTDVLAGLPVVGAPAGVHRLADLPPAPGRRGRVSAPLAWLGTAAVVVSTVAGLTFGLPALVAADTRGDAPVVMAEPVSEGPAARQLATPGDDVPEGGVEQLVVRGPAPEPADPATAESAPEPSPEPTASPEPSPTAEASPAAPAEPTEPSEQPSPEPSPEPSEDPLERLLPTGP